MVFHFIELSRVYYGNLEPLIDGNVLAIILQRCESARRKTSEETATKGS